MAFNHCTEHAPAKINLFLHIVGKQDNGYHLLESLVVFTKAGDRITITEADEFSLTIEGDYAAALQAFPMTDNLISQTVFLCAKAMGRAPNLLVTLEKNLPLASGIGGGSADAAATLRALTRLWQMDLSAEALNKMALKLGADVPACLTSQSGMLTDTATFTALEKPLPETFIVLVNPQIPLSTPAVFKRYQPPFSPPLSNISQAWDWERILETTNDLAAPAIKVVPEIQKILIALEKTAGCAISRMSGSGATCFGLYQHKNAAEKAAAKIKADHPDWWVVATEIFSA
ncbi:MAG: 4-(cytidine 5'-diphospho)-2-C-methyl-D-erythritol kinase [Alphaproteobacteria bacterium]